MFAVFCRCWLFIRTHVCSRQPPGTLYPVMASPLLSSFAGSHRATTVSPTARRSSGWSTFVLSSIFSSPMYESKKVDHPKEGRVVAYNRRLRSKMHERF